jgi:hypothetical protein
VNPLLLLGILGVGGYFLLSSGTASAASAPAGAGPLPSPGAAPSPGSTLPVYQTPALPPTPGVLPVPSGGQVYDPTLGGSGIPGLPTSGLQPGFGGEYTGQQPTGYGGIPGVDNPQGVDTTTQGLFGHVRWDPLSRRWY